jgi:phosphopantothenoylcysteine decarboxylase/phosphopantothenate--cysteine ligase
VAPVLTKGALRFVGETTFAALSSEPPRTDLFTYPADPIPHTRLGRRADLVVVAPATARLIGEYAAGISSGVLTATLLATTAPVLVCPAMHTEMWQHAAVQENLATLRRRGVHVLAPDEGRLAGGDIGEGRLPDPERIVAEAASVLAAAHDLAGLSILVTAGGTREPIDPVRFIGNRSSGKQGHAIAAVASRRGAAVTLVTTALEREAAAGVDVVLVETSAEMEAAVFARAAASDVVIMAAAVADFRPKEAAGAKIRKADGVPEIVLEPTADILAELGRRRRPGQILVGFSAETDDVVARATGKLHRKGVDLVVANDVTAPMAGFQHDTNAVTILAADGAVVEVGPASKERVGEAVLDEVALRLHPSRTRGGPGLVGAATDRTPDGPTGFGPQRVVRSDP